MVSSPQGSKERSTPGDVFGSQISFILSNPLTDLRDSWILIIYTYLKSLVVLFDDIHDLDSSNFSTVAPCFTLGSAYVLDEDFLATNEPIDVERDRDPVVQPDVFRKQLRASVQIASWPTVNA